MQVSQERRVPVGEGELARGSQGFGSIFSASAVIGSLGNFDDACRAIEMLCSKIERLLRVVKAKRQQVRRLRKGLTGKRVEDVKVKQDSVLSFGTASTSTGNISVTGSVSANWSSTSVKIATSEERKSGDVIDLTKVASSEGVEDKAIEMIVPPKSDPVLEIVAVINHHELERRFEEMLDKLKVRGDRRKFVTLEHNKYVDALLLAEKQAEQDKVFRARFDETIDRQLKEIPRKPTHEEFCEWYRKKFGEELKAVKPDVVPPKSKKDKKKKS